MFRNGVTLFNKADRMSKTIIWQGTAGQVLQQQKSTGEESKKLFKMIEASLSKISLELELSYGSGQNNASDLLRYSNTVM
ncbi:hypothetical protein TNCV_4855721 [Trichonephila clavipes]|nr:hypothetical protein TNCV_4855721 [Trichonephila clavipes]